MKTRFGPARVPSRETPEAAIELLLERGYSACEIDFEGGFWMKPEWEWAARFGELAKKSNTLVLPANVADVGSMIALAMKSIQAAAPPPPAR